MLISTLENTNSSRAVQVCTTSFDEFCSARKEHCKWKLFSKIQSSLLREMWFCKKCSMYLTTQSHTRPAFYQILEPTPCLMLSRKTWEFCKKNHKSYNHGITRSCSWHDLGTSWSEIWHLGHVSFSYGLVYHINIE